MVKDVSLQIPLSCEEADCEGLEMFVVPGSNVTLVTLEVTEMCETTYTATALRGIEVRGAYLKTGKNVKQVNIFCGERNVRQGSDGIFVALWCLTIVCLPLPA